MALRFRHLASSPILAGTVSTIVVIESDEPQPGLLLPLIANGFPGLAFYLSDAGNDRLFLYGQYVKPVNLEVKGRFAFIAYFFYPHVLKTLFGYHAKEFTDINVDLDLLKPAIQMRLKEQLVNITDLPARLQLINDFVLRLLRPNVAANASIQFATQMLQKNKGLFPLPQLQKELRVTERTFQRLFESHVGVSPRLFGRICQFQSAFQQLNTMQFSKLSDVAFENGFSDRSHLIRVFKEFTSLTPSEYLQNTSGLDIE